MKCFPNTHLFLEVSLPILCCRVGFSEGEFSDVTLVLSDVARAARAPCLFQTRAAEGRRTPRRFAFIVSPQNSRQRLGLRQPSGALARHKAHDARL
jgi:hypothetical protein